MARTLAFVNMAKIAVATIQRPINNFVLVDIFIERIIACMLPNANGTTFCLM
jgi:hypothetical protein